MVVSSLLFIFYFLPLVLGLYYLALKAVGRGAAHLVLAACSYIFYGWANPAFVFVMLYSTLIDYVCGLVITGGVPGRLEPGTIRTRRQKCALVISIVTNLSLLGFF